MGSAFEFGQHGESGLPISSLFPNLAERADDLCVIKSMHCSNSRHGRRRSPEWHNRQRHLRCGKLRHRGRSIYGLCGSENQDFPGYVTICQDLSQGSADNFGSAFLPAQPTRGRRWGFAGERARE